MTFTYSTDTLTNESLYGAFSDDSDTSSIWTSSPDLTLQRPRRLQPPDWWTQGRSYLRRGSSIARHEDLLPVTEKPKTRNGKWTQSQSVATDRDVTPQKQRWTRWRLGPFSLYRRIFGLAFLGNLAALVYLIARSYQHETAITAPEALTAVSVNLLVAILARNEHVVNTLFFVFGTWPAGRVPLWTRHVFAKIYCYGGVHSGCAVAATMWYMLYMTLATEAFFAEVQHSLLAGYSLLANCAILAALLLILAFAHPWIRSRCHNWFEGIHRFLGWTVVVLFWVLLLLETGNDASEATSETSFGSILIAVPSFWLLLAITILVVYPWTRLKRRELRAEKLSKHCIRLHFDYRNTSYGQAVRLSDAPLRETHAFAAIPMAPLRQTREIKDVEMSAAHNMSEKSLPPPPKGFSVVVSRAGDWTSRIIDNPPTHLYTRGGPQTGVLRIAGLFSPVLVIATGSGIGPCMSLFVAKPEHPVRILWTTPGDPQDIYGREIVDTVYGADDQAVVVDTRKDGRPDMVRLAWMMWRESKCEACVIISNPKVTKTVVCGLEERGVRCYGVIFDS